MKLIFLLSLSGSACLVFSVLLQKAIGRHSLYRWQDLLMKAALFLYLAPCPAVWIFRRLSEKMRKAAPENGGNGFFISHKEPAVLLYEGRVHLNVAFWFYLLGTAVGVSVMLFFLIRKLRGYRSAEKSVISAEGCEKADILESDLERLKSMVHLKRDIRVCRMPFSGSAFVMGCIHPVIIIPDGLREEQRDVVLLHEICHIKRNDLLFRFFVNVAVCVHWFNPLIYLLPALFNRNCELNCDEMVIRHLSSGQRKIYAREIITQSEDAYEKEGMSMGFGRKTKLTKERVVNIMKEKRTGSSIWLKGVMVVLTSVIVAISSLPICAYDGIEVQVLDIDGEEAVVHRQVEGFYGGDIIFTSDESLLFETGNIDIRFDHQFVDEDGNIYEVNLNEDGRAGCTHLVLISGTYQDHIKNSNGSCVVKTYMAK